MTTQSACVVQKPQIFKDADYLYTQVRGDDLSFASSSKEEQIRILSNEDEVQNYIEALNTVEKSNEYVKEVKAKIFTQFSIKKGLKNSPIMANILL